MSIDEIQTRFSRAFRESREASGLSQSKVAQRLSTTEKSVWNWEHGEDLPGLPRLVSIAELFGWDLPFLEQYRWTFQSAADQPVSARILSMLGSEGGFLRMRGLSRAPVLPAGRFPRCRDLPEPRGFRARASS